MATIPLDLLESFATVAELSSFSLAARRLELPKSSVSRRVSQLEESVGVRLLQRTTRAVSLSTAGAALYERIAPQLVLLRGAVAGIPDADEHPAGLLRATTTVDLGTELLAEVATRFTARYPAVEVDLRLDNRIVDLVRDRVDFALRIARGPLRDSSLTARRLGPFSTALFAAPTYLARRGQPRSVRELEAHAWVALRGAERVPLQSGDETLTVKPKARIVIDDMSAVMSATREGAGVAMLPLLLAHARVRSGELVRVLPRWSVTVGTLYMLWPGGAKAPRKVLAFRDLVAETWKARAANFGG